ncbi:hypothetical protein GW17_00044035, partial [Ensete ventricosum]
MVRPSARVAGHGQAPRRGDQPRPGHLQRGDRLWPSPLCKGETGCGQPARVAPAASSQGAVDGQGQPPPMI